VKDRAHPPRLWIELRLERPSPRLLMDTLSEGEFDRLSHWITSQPDLHDLFVRAVEARGPPSPRLGGRVTPEELELAALCGIA
jgi:hypothetical protein